MSLGVYTKHRHARMSSFYSYPPTFLETLLSLTQFVEESRLNPAIDKEELALGVEKRASLLIGKLVAVPTCTAFCIYRERDERTY